MPGDEYKKADLDKIISTDSIKKVVISKNNYNEEIKKIDNKLYNLDILNDFLISKFDKDTLSSPALMALVTANLVKAKNLFLVGFDGYEILTQTEQVLFNETETIFNVFKSEKDIISLTPTKYNIEQSSVYALIQ